MRVGSAGRGEVGRVPGRADPGRRPGAGAARTRGLGGARGGRGRRASPTRTTSGSGARIGDVGAAWGCDLVLKVKEPQPSEFGFLRDDQVLFTYLHLAANRGVADALRRAGHDRPSPTRPWRTAAAGCRCWRPMSEIAGRLAVQAGARYLERPLGGRGVLLGGVAGVAPGSVVVIGGGIVGTNAAVVAAGMQAHVAVLDTDLGRLRELELLLAGRVTLLHSTQPGHRGAPAHGGPRGRARCCCPGRSAPRLVTPRGARA